MAIRLRKILVPTFGLLIFPLYLSACNPSMDAETTSEDYHFAVSFSSQPAAGALVQCASESLPVETPFSLDILFPSQMDPAKLDLVLHLEPQLETFPYSASLAREDLYLISHRTNSVNALAPSELQRLFAGSLNSWQQLGGEDLPIQLWLSTESDESSQLLSIKFMQGSPFGSLARLASSPSSLLSSVAEDIYALGILPGVYLDNSVNNQLVISDIDLLLSSPIEFSGELESIATCLQSGSGHAMLKELYDG